MEEKGVLNRIFIAVLLTYSPSIHLKQKRSFKQLKLRSFSTCCYCFMVAVGCFPPMRFWGLTRRNLTIAPHLTFLKEMQLIKTLTQQQSRKSVHFDRSRNVTRIFRRKDAPQSIHRQFKAEASLLGGTSKGILQSNSSSKC